MKFDFNRVIDIIVDLKCVLIRPKFPTRDEFIDFWYFVSEEKFNNFVHLYKKNLRSQPWPCDRVAHFETLDSDGLFSLSKYDRVLRSRCSDAELAEND